LWFTLSLHAALRCDFFMKADADAWVDVPGLLRVLNFFNASTPAYIGKVTYSHGQAFEKWETFAHGLGYILSRGALQTAWLTLKHCLAHLARHRLDSIEDMILGSCLRSAHIYAEDIGPVVHDFKPDSGDATRVLSEAERPLIVHPVSPADMFELHTGFSQLDSGRNSVPNQANS